MRGTTVDSCERLDLGSARTMSDTLGLKRPRFRGEVTQQSADSTMSSRLNRRNQGARSPTHSTTASCIIDTNDKDHEKGDNTVKRLLTRARWTCRRSAVVALMAGSGGIWIMGNLWKFSRTLSPGRESSSVVASLPLPSLRINTARSTGPTCAGAGATRRGRGAPGGSLLFLLASRRAAQRLGLSYEGVFRQAAVIKGRNRDTAWFASIDSEWPALQEAFEMWLSPANFDADGRQNERLSDLTRLVRVSSDPAL